MCSFQSQTMLRLLNMHRGLKTKWIIYKIKHRASDKAHLVECSTGFRRWHSPEQDGVVHTEAPTLRRCKQDDHTCTITFCYIQSCRLAWATHAHTKMHELLAWGLGRAFFSAATTCFSIVVTFNCSVFKSLTPGFLAGSLNGTTKWGEREKSKFRVQGFLVAAMLDSELWHDYEVTSWMVPQLHVLKTEPCTGGT